MNYPAELSVGDRKSQAGALAGFFNARGWEHTWDFDKHNRNDYWHEVKYNGRIIMQIEADVTVDDLVASIKESVPGFDETVLDDSQLKKVAEFCDGQNFYIWPTGKEPKWKAVANARS